ncbi:hypothetical protein SAMN04487996_106281 [Dyadobacter soli]|uniref:DUF2442 domain-containing protein n=1 Tax=Dyadobacter soli TaxID=659014 RepID=A0A1G7F6H6_9BACT|nr:hypothetical protein [Dyadobacter soli]SDE71396.1 hypothetical protein SAMN04487996_106281 [Dyadobacter soli]
MNETEDFWDTLDDKTKAAIEEGLADAEAGRDIEFSLYMKTQFGIDPSHNPRIKEILAIEPFIIKSRWTDGQVRVTDFGKFLVEYQGSRESPFGRILQPEIFIQAKTDGRTILWDNMTEMEDYDGTVIPAPLDFCPDVLFQNSTLA